MKSCDSMICQRLLRARTHAKTLAASTSPPCWTSCQWGKANHTGRNVTLRHAKRNGGCHSHARRCRHSSKFPITAFGQLHFRRTCQHVHEFPGARAGIFQQGVKLFVVARTPHVRVTAPPAVCSVSCVFQPAKRDLDHLTETRHLLVQVMPAGGGDAVRLAPVHRFHGTNPAVFFQAGDGSVSEIESTGSV